ncbi:MAG: PIN domain-containing protein [Candidatus Solibacter usitatus]|nr:PIN domain-containing protein [Candidatus Solibacter usitatus]
MITAVDTNVFISLWGEEEALSFDAQRALDRAGDAGALLISALVYCEMIAAPGRDREAVDRFLQDTGVAVDWDIPEAVWRAAGAAYQEYAIRRRRQMEAGPRRLLADFLIGAHALHAAGRLLTMDEGLYEAAFPGLRLIRF